MTSANTKVSVHTWISGIMGSIPQSESREIYFVSGGDFVRVLGGLMLRGGDGPWRELRTKLRFSV